MSSGYKVVIGLEVHVHLKTKSKAFCGCSTVFGAEANSHTCPVCLGFPGSLPVLNKKAFESAIMTALALSCKVNNFTKFDRKNYFYPDLPKNFQISQYDLPLAEHGFLEIETESGPKRINITRVHFEEDAGKLVHKKDESLVDFNRAGMPLLEIVSDPDINSPDEAYSYLSNLKPVLQYIGVSDCDMEKGSLRCDANISIQKKDAKELGVKAEIKNMNSFKAVKEALSFEVSRQAKLLDEGGRIVQETRLWDEKKSITLSMRSKEGEQDYRYFPEPDLLPFTIKESEINRIKSLICELPNIRFERFVSDYKLSEYDARILISQKELADYFEECVKMFNEPQLVCNWINGTVASEINSRKIDIAALNLSAVNLVALLKFVKEGKISNLKAKDVLKDMLDTKKSAEEIIKAKNLFQVSDRGELEKFITEVINDNKKSVDDYNAGKKQAVMFLVGQVMSKTKGKANPKVVQELLTKRLDN